MTQLGLAFDRRHTALTFVVARPDAFRADFGRWLGDNWPVYEAFEREADAVRRRGRTHYSARTIGEFLRHESATREGPNVHDFKLNDHYWPDLARLYVMMHPEAAGFFEFRVSPTSARAA